MAEQKTEKSRWYRVDTAGIIYSALQTDNYSAVYRCSAVMTDRVDPDALQRAAEQTMPRFPALHVRIKRGMFWYYFEPEDRPGRPKVQPDIANPCAPLRRREKGSALLRIYYYERRISIEVFHALADGTSGLTFLRTLLAAYLRERGFFIPNTGGVLDLAQPPEREELEDAYDRYATVRPRSSGSLRAAYQPKGTPEPFYTLNLTVGLMPLDLLREAAHRYKVSITEYLASVLLHVLLAQQKKRNYYRPKPVALALPADLRSWFPSKTLRNFILNVRPVIDPRLGDYTFAEITAQVHHYMRLNLNRQLLQARIAGNAAFQRNRLLQLVPCFLKDPILRFIFNLAGVRPFSCNFTNPGAFRVPPEMEPHIDHLEVTLGQPYKGRTNCAAISYANTMAITFASIIQESALEREFFRFLVRDGVPVKITSNRRGPGEHTAHPL